MEYIQDSLFGKMYQEHFQVTVEKISGSSSKRSSKSSSRQPLCLRFRKKDGPTPTVIAETDGASLTEFLTLNIGESPSETETAALCAIWGRHSVAVESTLSSILMANVPEKYYLSAKACKGILRRAELRGKELKPMLKVALEQMVEREKTAV